MSNDQNLVFRVAGQGPTWNVLNGEGDIGHSVIWAARGGAKAPCCKPKRTGSVSPTRNWSAVLNRPPNRRRSHE